MKVHKLSDEMNITCLDSDSLSNIFKYLTVSDQVKMHGVSRFFFRNMNSNCIINKISGIRNLWLMDSIAHLEEVKTNTERILWTKKLSTYLDSLAGILPRDIEKIKKVFKVKHFEFNEAIGDVLDIYIDKKRLEVEILGSVLHFGLKSEFISSTCDSEFIKTSIALDVPVFTKTSDSYGWPVKADIIGNNSDQFKDKSWMMFYYEGDTYYDFTESECLMDIQSFKDKGKFIKCANMKTVSNLKEKLGLSADLESILLFLIKILIEFK